MLLDLMALLLININVALIMFQFQEYLMTIIVNYHA